jgi:hypothetical protein
MLFKEPPYQISIADIAHNQLPLAQASACIQIGCIPGIGHLVEDYEAILRILTNPVLNGMGSDESGSSGN